MPYADRNQRLAYLKEYRAKNPDVRDRNAYQRARRHALRKLIQGIKESNPCSDCGKKYPFYVMDFDHTGDKELSLHLAVSRNWKPERALAEIEKCDLVCSNCHRIRTWNRAGWSEDRIN